MSAGSQNRLAIKYRLSLRNVEKEVYTQKTAGVRLPGLPPSVIVDLPSVSINPFVVRALG